MDNSGHIFGKEGISLVLGSGKTYNNKKKEYISRGCLYIAFGNI